MRIVKIILPILFFLFGMERSMGSFSNETLNYVVSYKWGVIHKDAGTATVRLRNTGSVYDITLTARSKKWADSFFSVRDTLRSKINVNGFKPVSYEKIAHEGGKYSKDVIKYKYIGSGVEGYCSRYKDKKGKISSSQKILRSSGEAYDFLSVFFYLRTLNFENLLKSGSISTTVFSGSKIEKLTVRCLGKESIKLRNKTTADTYHIQFNFTTSGKKKSSDDIDAWISSDSKHIPLLLIGKLPVGQIKVYYVG